MKGDRVMLRLGFLRLSKNHLFLSVWLVFYACKQSGVMPELYDAWLEHATEDMLEAQNLEDIVGEDGVAEILDPISLLEMRYCRLAAQFFCETGARCNCEKWEGFISVGACKTILENRCFERISFLFDGLSSGSLELKASSLEACAETVQKSALSCEVPNPLAFASACSDIVVEKVEAGMPCSFEGVLCADGEGLCFSGLCNPLPELGQGCESLCRKGGVCIDGTCKPLQGKGRICSKDIECDMGLLCVNGRCDEIQSGKTICESDQDCGYWEKCVENRCTFGQFSCTTDPLMCGNRTKCYFNAERRCAPKGGVGASCKDSNECQDGYYCAQGSCKEVPKEGELCGDGIYCADGLACSLDSGTCNTKPDYGEPCALGPNGPFICKDGLGCRNDICMELPGLGDECTADAQCAEGFACNFTANGSFCDYPHRLGERCQTDQTCAKGLYCDFSSNQCEEQHQEGAPCKIGNECADGLTCTPDKNLGFACHKVPTLSEPCFAKCADGLFCKTFDVEGICLPSICTIVVP